MTARKWHTVGWSWTSVQREYLSIPSTSSVRQKSGLIAPHPATGAIIGGAATGHVRAASIGAAAGAAAGALTGAIVQENQAARYGPPPPGCFPFARWAGTPALYYSPYTGRIYDLRGVPPGGLTRDVDTGRLFRKS